MTIQNKINWTFLEWVVTRGHAKTAVIDGVLSVVGSANLDMRSFLHNNEISAIVAGAQFGGQMKELFKRDLEDASAIELKAWRSRPLMEKTKEFLANLFRYWL